MKAKELVVGTVFGVLLAGVGLLLYKILSGPFTGANSPIKIVGGSVKLEAPGAWSNQTSGKECCVVSYGQLDGTYVGFNPALPSHLYSWIITINLFKKDGSSGIPSASVFPSNASGACNPDPNNSPLCLTSANTYVASQTPVSGAYFLPDSLPDGNGRFKRYRYRDTNCCNAPGADYRESVASITISYKTASGSSVVTASSSPCNYISNPGPGECVVNIGR